MASSLTFSSLSLNPFSSPLPNHLQQQSPVSLSVSKPLKFRSIKAMATPQDKVKGGAGEIMDGIKESAIDLKNKVTEMKDKSDADAKETANLIVEKIELGSSSAAEIGKDIQDKTGKAVTDAWDAAKDIITKE